MEVNVELHEMINEYVNSVKLEDIYKELDLLQAQYNSIGRLETDILHMIELGDNLSRVDIIGLFDMLKQILTERRYIKSILKVYMNPDAYDKLITYGTIARGNKRYKNITHEYHGEFNDTKLYAIRSNSDSSRIVDFIKNTHNGDMKFSKITTVNNDKLEEIKCKGN